MHPTQEAIDAFAQEKGYVTVKLLYWPASGGENSQAQAEDFAARLATAEDKDALYAEMAQQLGIEAGDTGRTFSAEPPSLRWSRDRSAMSLPPTKAGMWPSARRWTRAPCWTRCSRKT